MLSNPLPRRPAQWAPTQEMDVEMKHGLAGLRASVDDQAKAIRHALLLGHLPSHDEELPEQICVLDVDGVHAFDVLVGYDQHVRRRLGITIVKGGHVTS